MLNKEELLVRVDAALDDIRPHLIADGGNVELVRITDDLNAIIRWVGNCKNCSMSIMTLRAGIQQAIRMQVPEINEVIPENPLVV